MPIYEYFCPNCEQDFELLRSVSQADGEARCPTCKAIGARTMSKFACRSSDGSGSLRSFGGGSCSSCATTSCGSS